MPVPRRAVVTLHSATRSRGVATLCGIFGIRTASASGGARITGAYGDAVRISRITCPRWWRVDGHRDACGQHQHRQCAQRPSAMARQRAHVLDPSTVKEVITQVPLSLNIVILTS